MTRTRTLLTCALLGCALLLVGAPVAAKDKPAKPRKAVVGVFYQPKPHDARGLKRLAAGNPGGAAGFEYVIAPILRVDDNDRIVWPEYLGALRKHADRRVKAVLDLHVLATKRWTTGSKLRSLLREILTSELAPQIGGWYVADEPFGRSRPGRKNPLDVAQIARVVTILRGVQRALNTSRPVFACYGSVFPLLKTDGDLINGGWNDATDDPKERAPFFWDGAWVTEGRHAGLTIRRRFGAFGEDASLVTWYGTAPSLERWLPRILKEQRASRLHIVTGYDTTPRKPADDARWVTRVRAVVALGAKHRVGGYWFWPWGDVPVGGRVYKGVSGWWEDAEDGTPRYAALVESIR